MMFGKKKDKRNAIEVTRLSSLVADNLQVVGDVLFTGGLRVDGKIEGNVLGREGEKSLIVLSQKGCIVGRVRAYDAVINGTISGDLEVEHFLELQAGARVSGNISYRQLQMECGATIEGQLVCTEDVRTVLQERSAAPVVPARLAMPVVESSATQDDEATVTPSSLGPASRP
ncbi:MAG: polymer-forming cytoskeletal protein [Rhodocyclaceae bacterium]|jgi:cytoskeletal protein CcmA (bactofilin family)|nr:polymer-forming cytoskeletal protein [Rhodocyclaceae bacterium]